MPRVLTMLLAIDAYDESTSYWRGLVLFAALAVIGAVWVILRRRWAPRTLRAWSGEGIRPDLTPTQAALLLRLHPARIVAVALEPALAAGRARVTSVNPLRLAWSGEGPADRTEEAIARLGGPDGRLDTSGLYGFLDDLQSEVEEAMTSFSGRATAVHYRLRVRDLWRAAIRTDSLADGDRTWLLLQDPAAVIGRIRPGAVGDILHDLIRISGVFRAHLLPASELTEHATRTRTGFFRYRRDLHIVRTSWGERFMESGSGKAPRSPFQVKLEALAVALDGRVTVEDPSLPLLFFYIAPRPSVAGRYRGRDTTVTLGASGDVEVVMTCSAGCSFQIVPASPLSVTPSFATERVLAGAAAFDDAWIARHSGCSELEQWVGRPRMLELVENLAPLVEIAGLATRIRLRFPYDRARFTVGEITARLEPLLTLAQYIEERRVASGASGPSSGEAREP